MLTFSEKLALLDATLADADALVARAAAGDLRLPTPCAGWDLAALLGHMIGQNNGFAAAVTAGNADRTAYDGPEVLPATVSALWTTSTAALRAAFAAADPEAKVHLAEFGFDVTASDALGMQLLDAAVHAWDVATSLHEPYRPNDTVTTFVLHYARRIAARPPAATSVFAAPLPETGDDTWSDALRLLGRPGLI
jgi:uncharacterized protein (TIGR03086 family)